MNVLGECEGFLDKSKVMSVFGDLTHNQRGIVSKENSFLPSINKSNIGEKSSFLSNSIINSKIYSNHEISKFFIFLDFYGLTTIFIFKNDQYIHTKRSREKLFILVSSKEP